MVPFQAPHVSSFDRRAAVPAPENSAKKRKWDEQENPKSILDIELHLEPPLPLDWERCLDIQSGKIHFYNSKTQKRTSIDPRDSAEEEEHMGLDLQLNLNCESLHKNSQTQKDSAKNLFGNLDSDRRTRDQKLRPPSRVSGDGVQPEMMAAVCFRCHLLVVLCKSSPECPNCKFMHSPDLAPPATLFKRRCSLSW